MNQRIIHYVSKLPFRGKIPILFEMFFSKWEKDLFSHFVVWSVKKEEIEWNKHIYYGENNIGLPLIDAPFLFIQVNSTSLYMWNGKEKKISDDNGKVIVDSKTLEASDDDTLSLFFETGNSMEQTAMWSNVQKHTIG